MANLAYQVTKGAYQGVGYKAYQGSVDLSPAGGGGYHPSQGLPPSAYAKGQTPEQLRKSREIFGLVEKVIQEVAKRQVETLQADAQKQYDELANELKLRNIEFEGRYLEALAVEREKLLDIEIKSLLQSRLAEEELGVFLMMVAAAA